MKAPNDLRPSATSADEAAARPFRRCHPGSHPQTGQIFADDRNGPDPLQDPNAVQDGTNPCGGQERQAIGRTRRGLNTKVTVLVDSKGRALQLVVDSGSQADIRCAGRIEIPSGHRLVADKGYDSTALRDRIWDAGSCPCIPNLKNRKNPARWHRGFYKLRHRVENFFQRTKRLRRVGTRYEKLSLHFLSFVQLAAILDWLKSPF